MTPVTEILTLAPGDTPWSYRDNPGSVPGPWPSVAAALAENRQQGGKDTGYWLRDCASGGGKALWIDQTAAIG